MRLLRSSPIAIPLLAFPNPILIPPNSVFFAKKPVRFLRKSVPISPCSAPKVLPLTEKEILESIVESDGNNEKKSLPCVRVYENDLARLTLIGDVAFEQAVTAAAADGGVAADEHILAGMSTMVIETVFPGPSDERSTVSTRLFLPAIKVKEKARKLIDILPKDMLSGSSKNILAMTFRQVVLQHSWSFELVSFGPGAERNLEDLENPREAPAYFTLSSSDMQVLSVLAEAVCMLALESTERDFHEHSLGTATNNFIHWFQKPRRIASKDFSVSIYEISQDEMVANANKFLENFNMKGSSGMIRENKKNYQWWKTPAYTKLEKFDGPEFISWTNEYLPAYRLQVDADKLKNLKLDGWKNSSENRWEVLLTHSQMVSLADALDIYYEDIYTVPDKQLSCDMIVDITNLSKSKSTSFWRVLSIALASGIFMVSISFLAQLYRPQLKLGRSSAEHDLVSLSEVECCKHHTLEASELEGLCISILKKINDGIGWRGDIVADKDGAWTGELPSYLRRVDDAGLVQDVVSSNGEDNATHFVDVNTTADLLSAPVSPSDKGNSIVDTCAQEIAYYQVVLAKDGKIIRLQSMNLSAANHWAGNLITKELHNGQNLSPGCTEPSLETLHPNEVVRIELLMAVNPESWFALARPVHRFPR